MKHSFFIFCKGSHVGELLGYDESKPSITLFVEKTQNCH